MNRVLRSSALWEALFRGLPGSVAVLLPHYDADGSLQDFEVLAGNGQFQKMTGLPEQRLLGARLSEVHPVFGQRTILNRYARALDRDESDEFEQLLPASQGTSSTPGWYSVTVIPTEGRLITLFTSIDKRKSVLVEAVRMMSVDDLTGIGNRRLLKTHFWRYRQRNSGMAMIYLDLNGFKQVNDRYGHETGDEVLRIIAQRLRNSLRPGEAVARLGGDEFAVLLDTGDREAARSVAGRLRTAINRPISIGDVTVQLNTSLGISYFPEDGQSFEALSAAADERMYRDKGCLTEQPERQGLADRA